MPGANGVKVPIVQRDDGLDEGTTASVIGIVLVHDGIERSRVNDGEHAPIPR